MSEDDLDKAYKEAANGSDPVLDGWSPGDVDRPMPSMYFHYSEDDKTAVNKAQERQARQKQAKPQERTKELTEFPLYMGRREHILANRDRIHNQINAVGDALVHSSSMVLATPDFKVIRAKSIWGLVWYYLKATYFTRKPKKLKLPEYPADIFKQRSVR